MPVYAAHRSRTLLAVLGFAASALASAGAALAAGVTPEPAAVAGSAGDIRPVLDRLDKAQEGVKALRVAVVETRRLALLKSPEQLRGVLTFERPGRIRWEYSEPKTRIYVFADGQLTGWIPDQNRLEKVDVSRREERIRRMFAFGQDSKTLEKEFKVTLAATSSVPGADELILVPNSRRLRKRVPELRLWVDHQTGRPRQMSYMTATKDTVTYALGDLQLNPALPQDAFVIKVPPGAKVEKGLSSLGMFAGAKDRDDAASGGDDDQL